MIKIKPGVSIVGIKPEIALAIPIIASVYDSLGAPQQGYDLTITSGTEPGVPHKPDSLHWQGLAVDCRIKNVQKFLHQELADKLADALGAEFDVILHHGSHIHIEYEGQR